MFPILLIVILTFEVGSGVENDASWYKGCYRPATQNATKLKISIDWNGPAQCTEMCGNARCSPKTHLRCGGHQSFTIFDASVQVVSNLTLLSPNHVNIANISTFTCQARLTVPWIQGSFVASRKKNASSNYLPRTSVLITWSIDGKLVKLSNKSIEEYELNDTLHHKFLAVGSYSLCCNVSNMFSWLSRCSPVRSLETISTFRLVNINGGHFVGNGLYAIPQHKAFYTEVIVNAGSLASLLFNFGDDTAVATVRPNYDKAKKNCSHLVLRRKLYSYSKRGLFSWNITALNELGSHSLIFPSRVVIDGIITGVQIVTKFAAARETKRIVLNLLGSFSYAMFDWTLENGELRTTNQPFLEVSFSAFKPQYKLKVAAYNNISRVESSTVIYIEPKIRGVTLAASSNVSSVNSIVILQATPQVDNVGFTASISYNWELGDGVSLPGTMANLVYRYKTSGRFEARVRVENFVSHVYSESVVVNVYKVITKVDVIYDSFLFGEITRLHARVVDGSDVTYIWDFGDNNKLVTSNHTVFHNYKKLGNYSVKVTAKNPISVKEDTIELFVLAYYCQKPLVELSRSSYPEYIRISSKIVLDVDVSVNCSVSNKTVYNWKVFRIVNGQRVAKGPSEIGLSPFIFSRRSLILPAYSLSPGKYIVELMVQMKGTLVRTHLSRVMSILPSEIKAIISGGKTILITRKSPENMTLDASKSFDPDDRNFTSFRYGSTYVMPYNTNAKLVDQFEFTKINCDAKYQWKCRSVLGNGFGDCFKPNATIAVNWTSPTLRFLPRIFVQSSSMFAFIVTVSRDGLKRSRAVQFIEVQEKTVRRLHIDCLNCRGSDVNGHKDIKFLGTCNDCRNSTVLFQWRVHFKPKVKVFLHHFGSCVPANGSSWKDFENLNGTNSTAVTASTAMPLTTVATSTAGNMLTSTPNLEEDKLQKLICESDLDILKKNWTDFEAKPRSRRDIFGASETFPRKHDLATRGFSILDDINDETDESFDGEEAIMDEMTNSAKRIKRNIENRTDSSVTAGNNDNVTATVQPGGSIDGPDSTLAPISGDSSSSATGNGLGSTNPGDTTGLGPVTSGFPLGSGSGRGPNVAGSGSGRGPSNSQGSGRGCEGSMGITGGAAGGSGGSGAATGCNGNGDGFGKGAEAHRNKTTDSQVNGTTGSDGSTSGNLVSEDKVLLQDEVKMIREIVNQHVLTTNAVIAESESEEFVIKSNTLIPGQLFRVDLIAFWPNDNGRERIAGRASQYFVTNTGPYLGSCKISPRVGTELKTIFSLDCSHWKDKHHPLTFSVKYWSPATQRNVLVYSGLYSNLKFTLPAGKKSSNNIVDIKITVEDTENVKTQLCSIPVQVVPTNNDSSTIEQEVYNQTIGGNSLLKNYEDTSDKVAVTIFVSNIAIALNRLRATRVSRTSHEIRKKVRTRLLQSIYSFHILTEVFALQLSGITRELVARPTEVSLKSVEWSNSICEKIIYFHNNNGKGVSNDASVEIARDIFAVLSSAIFSASNQKVSLLNRKYIGSLIKRSLRIHAQMLQILHRLNWRKIMRGDFLTTLSMPYVGETVNNTILLDGNTFILPHNFGALLRNISAGSSNIYAALTNYKSNPFRWGKQNVKIDTKVANLDFWAGTGQAVNISNLKVPIKIKLPVARDIVTDATTFSVKLSEMKIHQFNTTSVKEAMFIKVEDESVTESSEHYMLQALMSFNKEPNQKVYNRSLKFSERRAVIRIVPSKEASKVYIGILLRASGKVAQKKLVRRNYKLSVYTVSCRFWDETSEVWSMNGCEADAESTTSEVVCSCNHLTAFGGNIESLNGTVTVKSIVEFTWSDELHYLLLIILAVVFLHLFLMVIYSLTGKSNDPFKNFANLPDNHPADLFKYLVIVETGSSYNAGTTGRVSIVVYGEEGHSQIRELTCYKAEQFKRGSSNCVIMSFPDSLGNIKKIHLWHDNSGNAPDWFLKQVIIVDCQSERKWYFHWNNWLAISENGTADCEIVATIEPLSYVMQAIFEGFLDYHSWISIFTRPARSKYSCFQRLVTSFTVLVSYMTITAVFLHQTNMNSEILGFWDIKWIAVMLSIICSFSVLPLQLIIEAFFRNSRTECTVVNKSDKIPIMKRKTLPDEDITKPTGAVFFMEFNSSINVSQKLATKGGEEHVKALESCSKAGSSTAYCRISKWFNALFVMFWLSSSASGISITVLYSFSFQRNDVILWVQVLLLSFVESMFLIEMVKAFILSVRRFCKLNREEDIKEYVRLCNSFQEYDSYSKQEDITEKQIMVARARARFVRFSKPILGRELRSARKKVVPLRSLLSFVWHASTSLVFLLTLYAMLLKSNSTEKYYRNKTVKEMVISGSRSFENIETVKQFWNWSKNSLVDLLTWNNWHHLRATSESNKAFSSKIYTFGPAFLEKDEKRDVFLNRPLSNSTKYGSDILLVGQRWKMINIFNELESRQWISMTTKVVKISFVYFHPESSLFSNIILSLHVSPIGSLHSIRTVESIYLYSKLEPADKYLTVLQAICFLIVVVFLRNEFSSMMDKGIQHLACIWNVIEAMLIILTIMAAISYVCLYIMTQKAQYLISSMELNDSGRFLDLQQLIICKKIVLFVHATLLFLVIVRSMKLLVVWGKYALMLSILKRTFHGILSLSVIIAIITFALAHMGVLILMPESQNFSRVDLAWKSLWANFIIGRRISMNNYHPDVWVSPSFAVLSGLILFALKRLASVLYIGEFKEAKSRRHGRQARVMKTLKQGLHRMLSKKVWIQLLFDLRNRLLKKQGDQYKVCNLPLENVYEEIEYQVEEVLFRLNNLFDMEGRHEKVSNDDDELTLDSSEEAAYPSSYSTKDSISFTSESLYSEDSGYYRYGEYRCPSISNSDNEYEGPVIHHLEPPRQLFSDLGQKLTPIFGGRYFVKTSWSTFRTPKIQPGSIKLEPPPKVLPPIRKCKPTFDKVSNWSNKQFASETSTRTAADLFNASSTNTVPNHFENGCGRTEQADVEMGPYAAQPLKLPRALQSMAHRVKSKHDERRNPIQLPPTMAELRARGRRRHPLKRSQIEPLHINSASSFSISSENSTTPELFSSKLYDTHNGMRSSSIDSGIINSSGIDDTQVN